MKKLFSVLFPVLMVGFLFTSCKKDNDPILEEDPTQEIPELPQGGDNMFSCDLNSETFTAQGFYAYATNFSDDTYNIYGVAEVGNAVIYVALPNSLGVGIHEFSPNEVYGIMTLEDESTWTTNLGETSGTVTIEEKTATRVKGTFEFTAASFDDLSVTMSVTNGVFNVEMR